MTRSGFFTDKAQNRKQFIPFITCTSDVDGEGIFETLNIFNVLMLVEDSCFFGTLAKPHHEAIYIQRKIMKANSSLLVAILGTIYTEVCSFTSNSEGQKSHISTQRPFPLGNLDNCLIFQVSKQLLEKIIVHRSLCFAY